jgi:imidazoleglycerol phosphate synthase glutamine amidotransferase subunit HisH
MYWRPIETAPQDGSRLLGWVDGEVRFIFYGKTSHVPIYGWNVCDQGAEDCDLVMPTHWMPLPPPPEAP